MELNGTIMGINHIGEVRRRTDQTRHDVLHVIVGRRIGRQQRPRRRQSQVRTVLDRDLRADGLMVSKSSPPKFARQPTPDAGLPPTHRRSPKPHLQFLEPSQI